MSIDIFDPPGDINASPGSSVTYRPRIIAAPFGSGYAQRKGDGINSVLASMSLTIENITADEARDIMDFFKAKKGYLPFMFQAPGQSAAKKWVASEFSQNANDDYYTVTASLTEDVNP